jgi:ferredoxin-type protein NapG
MAADPQYGRRNFLKDSAFSFLKTAQEYVKHRDASREKPKPTEPVRQDWLRPPGAVGEALFLERCTQCGDCIEACPFESIKAAPGGTPVLFPDESPCHLCDDFPCIAACETDALLPVFSREEVRMGLAVVTHRLCTAGQGCHACVSSCPTEALSMDFGAFRLDVRADRCVGCGHCEMVCRTVNDKIAIRVLPARLLGGAPGEPTG